MATKKILIVENHRDNGRFIAEYLWQNGYHAVWVTSVAEALAICASNRPDAIIAEPRVNTNGLTLMEVLHGHPQFGQIPVICISAETQQRQIDQVKELGAYAFIAKPCSNQQLAQAIETIWQKEQAFAAVA